MNQQLHGDHHGGRLELRRNLHAYSDIEDTPCWPSLTTTTPSLPRIRVAARSTSKARDYPTLPPMRPKSSTAPVISGPPEALLVAAVADCFILTFRAIARGNSLAWHAIDCDATATLDRVERVNKFTEIQLNVRISVPSDSDHEKIVKLLHKSEQNCLITNSMTCNVTLNTEITEA
jgi:organic hydroperoxide reductase OsmC/OhrA